MAYVVISHRNPGQVLRLVGALAEGSAARVLVSHDSRRSPLGASDIERAGGRATGDRIEMEWGGFSHVELIVRCLREAAERYDPDWVVMLSGQDYPLRPLDDIEADLGRSRADGLLGAVREVERRRPRAGDDEFFLRCRYRHYTRAHGFPHLPRAARPVVYARDLPRLVGVRRPLPAPLAFHASSDWFTLGRRAIGVALDASADRRLMRHFRRVAVPSESFFASVLLNRPELTIEFDHRRFASFSGLGVPHPDTLTSADFERIVSSGADFARKFDVSVDGAVLDRLDERRRSAPEPGFGR